MKMNIIYALVDPITDRVRYIGKTEEGRKEQRLQEHLRETYNQKKKEWFESLRTQGTKPDIITICKIAEGWEAVERFVISEFRKTHTDLLNVADGGSGGSTPGRVPSQKERDNLSRLYTGRKLSKEHSENISNALKGRKKSAEHCKKIGDIHRGKIVSEETKKKISSYRRSPRTQEQIEATREKLKDFTHTSDTKKRISESVKQNSKSKKPRKVIQLTLEGEFVKEWPSCSAARNEISHAVLEACQGKIKSCKGYIWEYME